MIDGRRVLALIPARGGSKGVPQKNIAPLGGRPLIAWTVAAAHGSAFIDRLILSSDDAAIIAAAAAAGCEAPFVRPADLASDTARSIDVVRHAMDWAEAEGGGAYDYLALLQPTSPLRTAADIDACIRACHDSDAPAAVTVVEPQHSPYWMYARDGQGRLSPLLQAAADSSRRQDLPAAYLPNGAVYVGRCSELRRADSFVMPGVLGVVMPPERSVDIDTPLDFTLAELLLDPARRQPRPAA
jgi:N-acylneuraminate cytidylyltransferase